MRKRNYTAMTLALAGVMVLGGAGVLSQRISDAKAEKVVTTKKKSTESIGQIGDSVPLEEKTKEKKLLDEKLGMYLPDGAKVKKEMGNGYIIQWKGYEINYYSTGVVEKESDSGAAEEKSDFEREEEADISIGDAVLIAKDAVKEYLKKDITGKKIEISLVRNDIQDNQFVMDSDGKEISQEEFIPIVNKRNYGVKYYNVCIDGIKNHNVTLGVNSVTGEVFQYFDFKYDETRKSWDEEVKTEGAITDKEKKKSMAVVSSFVKNKLRLGDVVDCYSFGTGYMSSEDYAGTDTVSVMCKLEGGDVVKINLNRSNNKVVGFEINPLVE